MSDTQTSEVKPRTPYEIIGQSEAIRTMVDHFYDLMESEPEYKALRDLHAPDLSPMRKSLAQFLDAWMGGPRTWFEERPGGCVMSAHKQIAVDKETAHQWVDAMRRAAARVTMPDDFRNALINALDNMAQGMIRRQ